MGRHRKYAEYTHTGNRLKPDTFDRLDDDALVKAPLPIAFLPIDCAEHEPTEPRDGRRRPHRAWQPARLTMREGHFPL
jgi:hypothetical protein